MPKYDAGLEDNLGVLAGGPVLSIAKLVARAEEHYLRSVASGPEEYFSGAG